MSRLSLKRISKAFLRRLPLRVEVYGLRPDQSSDEDRFSYQQRFNHFEIPSGSVVLDIGSGHYPFPLATILTDRYLETTRHRTGELALDERPFVISDISHLPFADKSVDFVYCSHLLEHVDDPLSACGEIMRVGKRGYIETPTLCKDMLFGWARGPHKWHVMAVNDTLIFCEYTERQLDGVGSSYWRDAILGRHRHPLRELFDENEDIFNVMFMWEGHFSCVVFPLTNSKSGEGQNLLLHKPKSTQHGNSEMASQQFREL